MGKYVTKQMQQILEQIKKYDTIIISRHSRPDGDAMGSAKGLQRILKLSFPNKKVLLSNEDYSEYLSFLGPEDDFVEDSVYEGALVIVCDTATTNRISNKRFNKGACLVKIDHHIENESYGDYRWVEDKRSSVCEMIAAFYYAFSDELKIDTFAATCIYTGMVTDTSRFKFSATTGDTMRLAAMLLDQGIDLETLFSRLEMKEYSRILFESYATSLIKMTENGVAYIYISQDLQKEYHLNNEDASACVSLMDCIKNSLMWIAFIENADKSIRVRLRSRFVTINDVGESFRGGGHECAAGATVYNQDEIKALLEMADKKLGEYKKTHEGWL